MAAVITPLAAPGAPTVVTIERTVHANNPRNLAEDPYVTNNPSLPFVFRAAGPQEVRQLPLS
jgi:hypothetical protein